MRFRPAAQAKPVSQAQPVPRQATTSNPYGVPARAAGNPFLLTTPQWARDQGAKLLWQFFVTTTVEDHTNDNLVLAQQLPLSCDQFRALPRTQAYAYIEAAMRAAFARFGPRMSSQFFPAERRKWVEFQYNAITQYCSQPLGRAPTPFVVPQGNAFYGTVGPTPVVARFDAPAAPTYGLDGGYRYEFSGQLPGKTPEKTTPVTPVTPMVVAPLPVVVPQKSDPFGALPATPAQPGPGWIKLDTGEYCLLQSAVQVDPSQYNMWLGAKGVYPAGQAAEPSMTVGSTLAAVAALGVVAWIVAATVAGPSGRQ